MVDGVPLIVTARPRTAGSPPYRASHAFLLSNATGAAPARFVGLQEAAALAGSIRSTVKALGVRRRPRGVPAHGRLP